MYQFQQDLRVCLLAYMGKGCRFDHISCNRV